MSFYDRTLGAHTDEIRDFIRHCDATIARHRTLRKGLIELHGFLLDRARAQTDLEQLEPIEARYSRDCTQDDFLIHLKEATKRVDALMLDPPSAVELEEATRWLLRLRTVATWLGWECHYEYRETTPHPWATRPWYGEGASYWSVVESYRPLGEKNGA